MEISEEPCLFIGLHVVARRRVSADATIMLVRNFTSSSDAATF